MANHVSSLTEQQVLDIVRNNYESLTLKLEDNLDQYERYSERPHETNFFTLLVRTSFQNLPSDFNLVLFNFLIQRSIVF